MWGFAPALTRLGRDMGFVPFVITTCLAVYILTIVVDFHPTGGLWDLLSPRDNALRYFGGSGVYPVLVDGAWWTLLTATWLHGGPLHILMNMMSLRNVAPIVSEFYGASRMIIIYVLSGLVGFIASTFGTVYLRIPLLGGGRVTVGASAAIAGLIGAVFYYGHRTGNRHVADQAKMWIFMFLIMGFFIRGIDNWAHLGGLAGGYVSSKFLDPLYPERMDHFLIAIVLLAISVLALVASLIHGLLMPQAV
jgi:rhomboid protease GluP